MTRGCCMGRWSAEGTLRTVCGRVHRNERSRHAQSCESNVHISYDNIATESRTLAVVSRFSFAIHAAMTASRCTHADIGGRALTR